MLLPNIWIHSKYDGLLYYICDFTYEEVYIYEEEKRQNLKKRGYDKRYEKLTKEYKENYGQYEDIFERYELYKL